MGYRFVFSQMFDVRPRNTAGDLDFAKMARIKAYLNLRMEELEEKSQRIINLRPKRLHLRISNDVSSGQTIISPPEQEIGRNIDFLAQLYDENTPEESDILSVFDILEATDELLKKKFEPEINYKVPVKNIFRANEEKTPELDSGPVIQQESIQPVSNILHDSDFFMPQVQPIESDLVYPELREFQPELIIPPIQSEIAPPLVEPILNFDVRNYYGREPDLSFWSRPQAEAQAEAVPGSQFLTPEFLLGSRAAKESLGWRANRRPMLIFLAVAFLIFSFIPLLGWVNGMLTAKNMALNFGTSAYQALILAKDSLEKADFSQAGKNFQEAYNNFAAANSEIADSGGWLLSFLVKIPGFSYLSSRLELIQVGQDMSKAGQEFTTMINQVQNANMADSQKPFTDIMADGRRHLETGLAYLVSAKDILEKIKISALPPEVQPPLTDLSQKMPQITATAAMALDWSDKFLAILGQQNAKKYLLVFQNNAEMRATGGFIGTYGLLDLDRGQVKNLFIDGIFNADGQLRENVVPPVPIQKISTAWSMHDANWFADFPTSAQKLMWFYEKTGGPTPDGVISLTPTVIERLLVLTGPVDLPEYGVSLNSQNFAEITQYKVEVDYDKELNQPKKILADFAPKFMDKMSDLIKKNDIEVIKVINQLLKEKHILLYFADPDLEQFVMAQGWGGQIKDAPQDYFSVVNTNINGFKTDKVIEEVINHSSQIDADGSVIDTLEITRHHQGGNSNYDWFDEVNADYLRVYLPQGTKLLNASGQTKEEIKPPIDYGQAGFKTDADILAEQQSLKKDEVSGTDIFEESGKTVFGNWVYVSPGETVTLTYRYLLPFKIISSGNEIGISLLAQKQSGSLGSKFQSQLGWPNSWRAVSIPGNSTLQANRATWQADLDVDQTLNFKFSNVK
jgi:hypothetical protein